MLLFLILTLLPFFGHSASNDSDFSNWTDIDGKQKVVTAVNSSDIDLSGQAFYVSGKSVSSAKNANTAIVSASVNLGEATFVKSALSYKPTSRDVKKAKINSVADSTTSKPRRKSSPHWSTGNGTQPVHLTLKEVREKLIAGSPIKN